MNPLDLAAIKAACKKFRDTDAWFPREIRVFNEWVPALVSRVEVLEGALRRIDSLSSLQSSTLAREVSDLARRALEGGEGA